MCTHTHRDTRVVGRQPGQDDKIEVLRTMPSLARLLSDVVPFCNIYIYILCRNSVRVP